MGQRYVLKEQNFHIAEFEATYKKDYTVSRKKGTNSILGITLTKFNTFS